MSLLLLFNNDDSAESLPEITVAALLLNGAETDEGRLVTVITPAWNQIVRLLMDDPNVAYSIDPRRWEEIIAGAYDAAGFDEVILTPRSGDLGRDVIATKTGVGSIRIFDQVKAYAPGHVVPANDVRALLGVITGAGNVSKGVVTTTSVFAPNLKRDPFIAPFVPHRLELRDREILMPWLAELAAQPSPATEDTG